MSKTTDKFAFIADIVLPVTWAMTCLPLSCSVHRLASVDSESMMGPERRHLSGVKSELH